MERESTTFRGLRYELLPFGKAEEEAAVVGAPRTLTVTCSPKHGPDHTVEVAGRLRALGHSVVVHIAARMVRSPEHLNDLLSQMAAVDISDAFVVGGDTAAPAGPYSSAFELLQDMRAHELAPRTIGVAAYPEGHPLIADDVLERDLHRKDGVADYMATQLCFDAGALVGWLARTRASGVQMPVYLGVPGLVDSRRLLEISARVGVGNSISYIRKQHGVLGLLYGRRNSSERLLASLLPLVGGDLGVAGLHLFTFNRLIATVRFVEAFASERAAGQRRLADPRAVVTQLER